MGSPSTVIRQLGQLPAAQSNPRGRWYLKLRLKTTVPDTERAEATVSPSNPRTSRPSNSNSTVDARSIASPGRGTSLDPSELAISELGRLTAGPECLVHDVGGCVPPGVEPAPAPVAMVPPFLLHSGRIWPEVKVAVPLVRRGVRLWPVGHLATKPELLNAAVTAVGAF